MKNAILRVLLALALLTLAACATTGGSGQTSADPDDYKAVVTERAVARWEALIKRDPATAWTYLSPGYRSTHPKEKYAKDMGSRPVKWFKVEPFVDTPPSEKEKNPRYEPEPLVETVECADPETSCTVRLKVHFKIASNTMGVGIIESWNVVKESWVRIKGRWYHVPQDVAG